MKEIVIGADIKPDYNSVSLWYFGDASENSLFYILNENMSDTRIYIYKESDEGAAIKEWLSYKENRDNDSVQRKALELLIPRLSVEEFLAIVKEQKKLAYKAGYHQAQYNIRGALGL